MTDEEKKFGNRLIAEFMGYPYYHHGVTIDVGEYWKDFQSVEIFSKVPIETVDDSDECYFKEIPNPNYKNSDDPYDKYHGKMIRWDRLNCDNYIYDLKYDWDWNHLMDVVEKIESVQLPLPSMIPCGVTIRKNICSINDGSWNSSTIIDIYDGNHGDKYSKKSSTWTACVEFIKWHNEQKVK